MGPYNFTQQRSSDSPLLCIHLAPQYLFPWNASVRPPARKQFTEWIGESYAPADEPLPEVAIPERVSTEV